MTNTLTEGLDHAVDELVAGLSLLEGHINRAGITDPAIIHLRDNLRRAIDAWNRDVQRTE